MIIATIIILAKSPFEHFRDIQLLPRSPFKEIQSPYWYKYLHFANKRSKCLDCDNSETE